MLALSCSIMLIESWFVMLMMGSVQLRPLAVFVCVCLCRKVVGAALGTLSPLTISLAAGVTSSCLQPLIVHTHICHVSGGDVLYQDLKLTHREPVHKYKIYIHIFIYIVES